MDRQVSCGNRSAKGDQHTSDNWKQCLGNGRSVPFRRITRGQWQLFGAGRPGASDGPREQDNAEFLKKTGSPVGKRRFCARKG